MDYGLVAVVVGAVVTVAAAVLGKKYVKFKGLLNKIVEAFDDDNVSPEEFKEIVDQAKVFLKGE
jgi:hypothetical protein